MLAARATLSVLIALLVLTVPHAAAASHEQAADVNGYRIALKVDPPTPKAGEATTLEVTVTRDGAPMSGLFLHLEVDDGITHTHTSDEVAPGVYRFDLPAGFGRGGTLNLYIGFTKGGVDHAANFHLHVTGDAVPVSSFSRFVAMGLTMVHGFAALALIGGTLFVVVVLYRNPAEHQVAPLLARRYTVVAWASLAALFATGFGRAFRLGLSFSDYFTSPYGIVLSVKIGLALLVLVYLAYATLRLVPRLADARADSPRQFRFTLLGQLVLFLVLLGTVQVLFMSHTGGIV